MLVIALALATAWATAKPIKGGEMYSREREVPSVLHSEALDASGGILCSETAHGRRIKAARNARFDRVYGSRFNSFVQAITAKDGVGWPDDFIFLSACMRATSHATAREERAFRAFGDHLKALETKYGISEAVR